MNTKLRWGIISTADINNIVIPAIRKNTRCEILAIGSRDLKKAEDYALKWNIPRFFGSYEEMLKDDDINAVYISLPNGLHHEWCIKSARAGKHILCEKPLATSLTDCEEIITEVQKNNVFLQEGFMYRYHPQTSKIHEIIQSNIIGDVKYLYGVFSFSLKDAYGDGTTKKNYRVDPKLGGGCLWDIGSYVVNFSRFITGYEPIEVFGTSFNYRTSEVDGFFCGQLKFPYQIVAQFECSYSQPQRTTMEIIGSKGTLRIPYPYCLVWDGNESPTLIIDGVKTEIEIEKYNSYEKEIDHFCDCVIDNKPRIIPLEDSLNNIKVLVSLHESAKNGNPVKIYSTANNG